MWNRQAQTAPSGCYQEVEKFFLEKGFNPICIWEIEYPTLGNDIKVAGLTLKDFQIEAIERAISSRYGVIHAPVRSGKTAIISGLINKVLQYPTVIVTNGVDLVKQTQHEVQNLTNQHCGFLSESIYEPANQVVTSYQALTRIFGQPESQNESTHSRNMKIFDLVAQCKMLILDECHHALAKNHSKWLNKFNKVGWRVGLSGTPKHGNLPKKAILHKIGPIIYTVTFDTLVKVGRIVQPKIIIYDLPQKWFSFLFSDYATDYQASIVQNKPRNKFISELVQDLQKKGKTSFVMVRMLEHGDILRDMIPGSVFVRGSVDSETRKSLFQSIQDKKLSCIIGTVGKEGLNIPTLDAVINAEGLASEVSTIQKLRSLTASEGKEVGLVFDFIDKSRYTEKHSYDRMKLYNRNKKAFEIITKQVPDSHGEEHV
jgi:superfamily II DNA or RNA helicase